MYISVFVCLALAYVCVCVVCLCVCVCLCSVGPDHRRYHSSDSSDCPGGAGSVPDLPVQIWVRLTNTHTYTQYS